VQALGGDKPLERNIKKLVAGRVTVVIEASPVFMYYATKLGVQDKVRFAGTAVEPQKAYIAFSPKHPKSKEYAKMLSDGIDAMRKSGELKKILEKYGLKDWK